ASDVAHARAWRSAVPARRSADRCIPPCPAADRGPERPSRCGAHLQFRDYAGPWGLASSDPRPQTIRCARLSLGYGFCNLFIKSHLQLIPKNESRILTTRTTLLESHENLSLRPVSNAVRTRATSHPCERGPCFLEK